MSETTGTADQILSLPKGGGAVQGLGEKFEPDLHTGTGSYSIPLDIPNGPNDIAPKLTLLYHTGAGNGQFGMGFSLNLLSISRSMDKRIPSYNDDDPLVLIGGSELIDIGGGEYRLRADASRWQIKREGDGFRLTDRDGKYYRLGSTEQAQLFMNEGGRRKVLSWHLEEIEDPLGNKVRFIYLRDGVQLYIKRIEYSIYTVQFSYETRPDPRKDGRPGFLVDTRLRCNKIELLQEASSAPLVRRWDLSYFQGRPNSYSLLHQVTLTGFDEAGMTASMPSLVMEYTWLNPRQLERFKSEFPGESPGALSNGKLEILDWDGDGLPDILETDGGNVRIWQNLGNCMWARPKSLGSMPVPVSLDEPGVAFADMDGKGTADLVMLDRPLAGYYPHLPRGGFDRPIFWRNAPSARLSDPNTKLVDLNGDGIIDLMAMGNSYLSLYLRLPEGGWSERPQTIPRSQSPPISLSDTRVRLADMNGDGLQDIVRVDGSGVTYWPYLGNGRWSDPQRLENSPTLPKGFDPSRMFLSDIDGDGCADLIYVDFDRVIYWLNLGGVRMSDPQEILYTPPALPGDVRMADAKGTGTNGVLWSTHMPGSRTAYFYLDFTGGIKPYMLCKIDNSMGLVTEIEYGVSTAEAARDKLDCMPWTTFLPFPVPVVKALRVTDRVTSIQSLTRYVYHNGHYDGVGREFAGFAKVEVIELGDASAGTMLTINWHHIGLDPLNLDMPLPEAERLRLLALRGKLLKTEVYGMDGSPDQNKPYMRTENEWRVEVTTKVNGVEVLSPRLMESRVIQLERQEMPYRITTTRNLSYDDFGNVLEQDQIAEDPREAGLRSVLHSVTSFARDQSGRFVSKPARIVQHNTDGQIIAMMIHYYDALPEGQLGILGLLTGIETLVLPDDLVSQVYGESPPDLAALGYHRRQGEGGWWVHQARYTRVDDANGLRATVTNARGSMIQIFFDLNKIHPVKIVDALGNSSEAVLDYRSNKLQSIKDANGAVIFNRYDPLGRLVMTVEPEASEEMPTVLYLYKTDSTPLQVIAELRTVNAMPQVITHRTFLDGYGQVLEERTADGQGDVIDTSQIYSARRLIKEQILPRVATGTDYALPTPGLASRKMRYDALGRLIELLNPDGSAQRQRFEPGIAFLYDEEDVKAGSPHFNTPIRNTYGPTGKIREVALNDNGQWITTRYEYDVKGNLVAMLNSKGQKTSFFYDLLGRRLATNSPESGLTLFIFDANGNQVEKKDARGMRVRYEYDELDRMRRVVFPDTGEVSAEYLYHDSGRPAPAEASSFSKGRIVKISHQGGEEVFIYDPLGRVTRKSMKLSGLPGRALTMDFTYRADGKSDTITYPEPSPGAARLQMRYEYDERGFLSKIPGYVGRIDYNIAGQRTRIEYVNGVTTEYSYNPLNLMLSELRTGDSSGALLQHFNYTYDEARNLTKVDSPDPKIASVYAYDDLYRLKAASTQSGRSWTYQYDYLGNITFKSDVGSYRYDARGLLISAGNDSFAYTLAGQVSDAPWGRCQYDPMGRMRSIARGSEQMICTYDENGRRVSMKVTGAAQPQNLLTPDDWINIENGIIFGYILDGSARVAQVKLATGAVSYLHGDHLGSTTLVSGPSGQVLQRVYYDPFGSILENDMSSGSGGTIYLYTGQIWDEWSGLLYLNARYYNPRLGRFMAPDAVVPEIFMPLAWNRYSYVQNNPLRFTDPTGHFWDEIGDWFKDNWKAIVSAVAIVAIAVLTVVTFGAAGLIVVGIGMAIGGVVGGIAAYQAGGDILLGVLVGMAVGGAASFASLGIGVGFGTLSVVNGSLVAAKSTLLTTVAAGTLSGAVTGAAMGYAAGFAGGQGTLESIGDRMWRGALIGAVTGFAFSFAAYGLQVNFKLPTAQEWKDIGNKAAYEGVKAGGQAANSGASVGPSIGSGLKEAGSTVASEAVKTMVKTGWEAGASNLPFMVVQGGQALVTSAAGGAMVLDWAEQLWQQALKRDWVKIEKSGQFDETKPFGRR